MLSLSHNLKNQLQEALEKAFPEAVASAKKSDSPLEATLVATGKEEFGDFQVNSCFQLAKTLRKSPRDIALEIVKYLNMDPDFSEMCDPPKIAGPGFINITISKDQLIKEIRSRLTDKRLGIPFEDSSKDIEKLKPVIIDFSSPNIAKEMHVGHLRSTIIGDSLARIFEFRGYKVLRLNHVGDWGTQFGMLISHLKEVAPEALTDPNAFEISDLVKFYKEAKKRFDEDENFQDISRKEVIKLQNKDIESLNAWNLLCEQSRREFEKIYERLDINIQERGESFYNPFLKQVINDLEKDKLLVTDDGAKCIFLVDKDQNQNNLPPVIVQKRDGGFNYATTDLAAIRYRFRNSPEGDGASRLIYVTDSGQSSHFNGVFQVAKRAEWIPKGCRMEHVPFGLVLGEDGKKLKTRSGETIKLSDLLDEAIKKAKSDIRQRLQKEEREESETFIEKVGKTIGIAAVKYADLSQNRTTDYQFSYKKMLSLQGNTAPYLLYAVVRIAGIIRKGDNIQVSLREITFNEDKEWSLLRQILKLDEVIIEVEEELLPNRLCTYLFELSQIFNRFYDQMPVLKAEEPYRSSRLVLCRLTADTLKLGLSLLGINTLERM